MNQQLEAGVTVDANKLLRQRDAERFDVLPRHRARILNLRSELESGLPEVVIVEEHARFELDLAEPRLEIGQSPARVETNIG
jgi:hypothetical protein